MATPKKSKATKKHADHDYIVARQDKYIAAWRSGNVNATMDFMDKEDFVYSNRIHSSQEGLERSETREKFAKTFQNFHDIEIKTLSLHGHKHFTAWEWDASCKAGLNENGEPVPKEKAEPLQLRGCTLMWWNDNDKVVKQHEYVLFADLEDKSNLVPE